MQYVYRSLQGGDYAARDITSREALFQAMLQQARSVRTDDERYHFRGEVSYALAAGSIGSKHGTKLYRVSGLTAEGSWR